MLVQLLMDEASRATLEIDGWPNAPHRRVGNRFLARPRWSSPLKKRVLSGDNGIIKVPLADIRDDAPGRAQFKILAHRLVIKLRRGKGER